MAKIVPSLLIIFLIPLVLSQDYEDGSEIGPDAMNDLMSDIDAMGSDYGEGESEDDENGDQYGSESIENEEIETQQSSPEHQLAKRQADAEVTNELENNRREGVRGDAHKQNRNREEYVRGSEGHEKSQHGHEKNGHEKNGHGNNGHEKNGHGNNGHENNGHGNNGHENNGHGNNGHRGTVPKPEKDRQPVEPVDQGVLPSEPEAKSNEPKNEQYKLCSELMDKLIKMADPMKDEILKSPGETRLGFGYFAAKIKGLAIKEGIGSGSDGQPCIPSFKIDMNRLFTYWSKNFQRARNARRRPSRRSSVQKSDVNGGN